MKKPSGITVYQEMVICHLLDHAWERIQDKVSDSVRDVIAKELTEVLKEWKIDLWRPLALLKMEYGRSS